MASPPVAVTTSMCTTNPPAQTANVGQAKTGNAATEIAPGGGTTPYTYARDTTGTCTPVSGATALPASSNFSIASGTGVYTYTAPTTQGIYYYCVRVCDAGTPQQCVTKTYTLTVACSAGTTAPALSATTKTVTCPATTADLTSLVTSTPPTGTRTQWHTVATNPTNADSVLNPAAVIQGTYYAYYYSASATCYSPASSAVTVAVTLCTSPAPTPSIVGGTSQTGNAATDLKPTGGKGPYTYSTDASVACVAPTGATALPAANNLIVNGSTGAYSYTAPTTPGTYYFCIKVCDAGSPQQCVTTPYTISVTCSAASSTPTLSATTKTTTCPATTADISGLVTSTPPTGSRVQWHTVSSNPTNADSVLNPAAVTQGTYYAYYYAASGTCYSAASPALTVTITLCTSPAPPTTATSGQPVTGNTATDPEAMTARWPE